MNNSGAGDATFVVEVLIDRHGVPALAHPEPVLWNVPGWPF